MTTLQIVFITFLIVLLISNSKCDGRTKRDDYIRTKIISGSGSVSSSRPDEEPFLLRSDSELLHFELDQPHVYVGGVNVLYQLRSGDLGVVHSVRTGPQLDSAKCHASGCGANISQEVTNNFNKVLVVDKENNKLLVCGSVYQGSCSKYDLQNISIEPEFLPEPVAANDARSTTFAFIGPQRYNRWGHGNVLYVGTTFTSHGDYRHDVPAISSRNLHDLQFAEYSFSKQSLLRIDVKYRDRFLVNYVYGFNTTSHIFFVTVQKRSHLPGDEEKGYVTRLARVCVSDVNYDTYTEVTLECGDGFGIVRDAFFVEQSDSLNSKSDYRLGIRNESFLVATFTNGKGPDDFGSEISSSVCSFPLTQINRLFDENIHNCFNGSMGHRNMEYISGPIQEGKCPGIGAMGNIHSFCDVGLKISGIFPIVTKPLQEFEGADVTAIHFAEYGDTGGVIVVGTSAGRLLVILLTPAGELKLLTDYQLTDVAEITKVVLSPDNDVIALQRNTLTKIRASNCAAHKTCSACVSSGDPFCGWCAFRNKCSHSADCHAHQNVSQWFSSTPRQCSHVEAVIPSSISLPFTTGSSHLNLVISSLPTLPNGESFVCVYANTTVVKAKSNSRGLQCPIPKSEIFLNYLSSLTSGNATRDSVQLDIRFATLDTSLVSTQVRLLDCSREATCHDCTRHSECSWCMDSNSCVAKREGSCYQFVRGPHDGIASDACPTLKTIEMSVPNDVPLRIELQFDHLPTFYHGSHLFWCLVHIEEAKFKVSGHMIWENSTVICDETIFNYNAEVAEIQATVSVLVNKNADLLDSRTITVYKCSVLGSYRNSQDCTLCIAHRASYGCTWCEEGCVSRSRCSSNFTECPGPEIFTIRPRSGPLEGGTVLTIEGSNLGTSVQDLRGRIKIGSRDCALLSLKNSVEATCLTPQSVPRERNVSVTLLTNQGPVQSPVRFSYADFFITNFSPTKGSISGGTKIRILGRNLDIGTSALAYLDEVPCHVDKASISSDSLVCTTSFVTEERVTQNMTLVIDGAVRQMRAPFFYTPNPIVHNIRPLTTIFSGGRIVSVHGEYFDSISAAGLLVYDHDGIRSFESGCKILSGRLMECVTPPLSKVLGKSMPEIVAESEADPVELHIGLRMDNATSLLHLSSPHSSRPDLVLHYLPDPLYVNFTNNLKVYKGDELIIEGSRLNAASDQNDVRVMIGNEYCNITSLTSTQLLCVPPAHQPPPRDDEGDLPQVTVLVGAAGLRYQIGHVKYNVAEEDLISSEVIGAISAVTAILISIGIVVLIVLKHKSSQVEREYKRIQIQMDLLENNVRSECKQAFAELQTDMTDLTMELEASGIPFVSHRDYVMNVFFPGVRDHPVLIKQDWTNTGGNGSTVFGFSMLQFEQLIFNKMFLVTLIDTVERQPNFGIRDRVNFASLLSLVLMTRMDYFSEVLKLLLVRLIEKSLCSRHPQLMLRRTETVVEKLLTNWLALCMYGHLERQAGSSLFLLYKAIKCQIEKGPVDMYTQESKYSLSEEGLLRDSRDYSPVTCLVLQRELDEAYHAKVLDCDSITQVKAKVLDAIYKNTPFSLRPSVEEVDLEWQCGQDAHVVLQDIDLTTKEEPGGLKKVNTLRHYGIKNKAVVSLVPKQFNVVNNSSSVMNNNHYIGSDSPHSKQLFHIKIPDSAQLNGRGAASSCSSSGGSSSNSGSHSMMDKAQKTIPEVFLTRLLSTKGTVKKFIDDFFRTILSTDVGEFPCAVKWLFDIFDESLRAGYIDDSSVVHSWKSNSLPLRFWINMIKNPDFVFDVEKTFSVELNLSIVAQALMSSCLPNDPVLNKESPSHKLLFAREINDYRVWISDFYERVQKMPQITDQDLNCYMHRLSQLHEGEFNRTAALKELFLYVSQYYNDLAVAFSGGIVSHQTSTSPLQTTSSSGLSSPRIYMSPVPMNPQQDLSNKLEHIFNIVKESDHLYACAS